MVLLFFKSTLAFACYECMRSNAEHKKREWKAKRKTQREMKISQEKYYLFAVYLQCIWHKVERSFSVGRIKMFLWLIENVMVICKKRFHSDSSWVAVCSVLVEEIIRAGFSNAFEWVNEEIHVNAFALANGKWQIFRCREKMWVRKSVPMTASEWHGTANEPKDAKEMWFGFLVVFYGFFRVFNLHTHASVLLQRHCTDHSEIQVKCHAIHKNINASSKYG